MLTNVSSQAGSRSMLYYSASRNMEELGAAKPISVLHACTKRVTKHIQMKNYHSKTPAFQKKFISNLMLYLKLRKLVDYTDLRAFLTRASISAVCTRNQTEPMRGCSAWICGAFCSLVFTFSETEVTLVGLLTQSYHYMHLRCIG